MMSANGPDHSEANSTPRIEQRAGNRAIQIGQVFGNVALQILSPKSIIIILVALAVTGTVLVYAYQEAQKPARMIGNFNIAVAQFGQITDQGVVASAVTRQLSKLLFDFLDSEYKATDFNLDVQVAHEKIGVITGDREAETLADDINADIVIYGTVFINGNQASLSPRFYVKGRQDTAELTGQHQLALPLQFDVASLGFQDEVNIYLRYRASILVGFTTGLAYMSANNLEAASRYFQKAVDDSNKSDPFDGEEVLYLFSAETARLQGNFSKAGKDLDAAIALNSEYARAYIGRGNIYYNQAIRASFDSTLLNQALAEYQRAIAAKDQPEGAYIQDKANVSLGNVYVILAQQTQEPALFAQAIDLYTQVVTKYESAKNERIQQHAAIAYFGLGSAYERQAEYAKAQSAYRRCIELALDATLKDRAQEQLDIVNHVQH